MNRPPALPGVTLTYDGVGSESETERFGCSSYAVEVFLAKALFESLLADVDVVLSELEQAEDELGKFARGSKDGGFPIVTTSDTAIVSPEGRLGSRESYSGHTQGPGDTIGAGAIGTFLELLTAGDRATWNEA